MTVVIPEDQHLEGGITLLPFSLTITELKVENRSRAYMRNTLYVQAQVIERNTGAVTTVTSVEDFNPEHMPPGYWPRLVESVLQRLLMHELAETLLVDGKCLRDPHPENRG